MYRSGTTYRANPLAEREQVSKIPCDYKRWMFFSDAIQQLVHHRRPLFQRHRVAAAVLLNHKLCLRYRNGKDL